MVNGVATGAGMDMALMCDIRYAAKSARFAETYVKVGLVPGAGGAHFLPRLVGISKALELFLTGDFLDADEALRIGIVNKVFPDETLLEEAEKIARDDVGGVPARPVVLGGVRLILAVMLLCLSQELCQSRDVHLLSPPSRSFRGCQRPGSRSVISWSSQPLPSWSLNEANEA